MRNALFFLGIGLAFTGVACGGTSKPLSRAGLDQDACVASANGDATASMNAVLSARVDYMAWRDLDAGGPDVTIVGTICSGASAGSAAACKQTAATTPAGTTSDFTYPTSSSRRVLVYTKGDKAGFIGKTSNLIALVGPMTDVHNASTVVELTSGGVLCGANTSATVGDGAELVLHSESCGVTDEQRLTVHADGSTAVTDETTSGSQDKNCQN
jgi:hypothetical protein